jgi:pyruvate kinase
MRLRADMSVGSETGATPTSVEGPRGDRRPEPAELAVRLEALRDEMRDRHLASSPAFARVHPTHERSAKNLVDYLTLRSHDMRPTQAALAELGASSLGRAEEHVIRSLETVIGVLHALSGDGDQRRTEAAVDFEEGRRTLQANAIALLGPEPSGRATRVMVTMPSEAADDAGFVRGLVDDGMECARINCAHDGIEEWARMVSNLRSAATECGRTCPILMDLPGPKLRTGRIADGPRVLRIRPTRDDRGLPLAPARAVLVGGSAGSGEAHVPNIPVAAAWIAGLRTGDRISLRDTRGAPRTMEVSATASGQAWVVMWDTTYVETGTELVGPHGTTEVGTLPPIEQSLRVHCGDVVTLTADTIPVLPCPPHACEDGAAQLRIGCTLPDVLRAAKVGHQVWFDDGKIGGLVRAARGDEIDVEITVASANGASLKGGRGINLPDTNLDLPAFGSGDDATLAFIAEHADLVGLSFAQRTSDITDLQRRLDALGRPDLGVLLKIETASGFHRLPELLLAGMASQRIGVMVARGDLAVECGFERLAEVQEEILWLCDAAHVPVVWATQVLDQMARTGRPSRAEVSDAVMGARAECVMLNKGPHIGEAVRALDDILRRMEAHQHKKVPLLRRLRSWSPG